MQHKQRIREGVEEGGDPVVKTVLKWHSVFQVFQNGRIAFRILAIGKVVNTCFFKSKWFCKEGRGRWH